MKRRSIMSLAFAGLLAFGTSVQAKDDKIIYLDGQQKSPCRVSQEKFSEVKFRYKRQSLAEPGDKILEVIHGDGPRPFVAGEGQRKGAQYGKAMKSYQAALETSGAKPWVKVYANLHLGTCALRLGQADKAISFFKKASADKEHLIYPRAQIGLGNGYAAAKRWADAERVLKSVAEARFGFWRDRATLALGNAYIEKGALSDARRAFAGLSGSSDASMKVAGVVGIGESYLKEKNFNSARNEFEKILRDTGLPREVAAGAWAGIGDCEMARAKEGKKSAEKSALLAYLRVVVQFAGVPRSYPKSLYQAAAIYEKTGRKEAAAALRRELKNRCPSSEWTKKLGS